MYQQFVFMLYSPLQIYIRFYGANCGIASNSQFDQSLETWLSFARRILRRDGSAPLIFIGTPAMERASPVEGCYQSTRDLRELYMVSKQLISVFCLFCRELV